MNSTVEAVPLSVGVEMVEEMVLEMLLPYAEVGNNGVNVGTEDE